MKNKKNILVVGGTGFIGYHLIKRCLKKSYSVTSISSKLPSKRKRFSKVKYFVCDVRDKKKLNRIIKPPLNFIVNLSGYVDHSRKRKTMTSHYNGCSNIAKILLKYKINNFVQIGSGLEYGNQKSPQKENFKCYPRSAYSLAKYKATNFLMKLSKKKNFPCTILRLYQAYGPNQDFNRLIPIVINSCLKKENFDCTDGLQKRDFLYIDDLIDLIFKIFSNKKSKGRIFNAGSGKPVKIKNLIQKIRKISKGGNPQFGKINMRKDEIKIMYPSIKLVKKILNWKPKTKLEIGLKKTIKSYSEK